MQFLKQAAQLLVKPQTRSVFSQGLFDAAVFQQATGKRFVHPWLAFLCYVTQPRYFAAKVSSRFDGAWYLAQYPDVAALGMNPLMHYLLHGQAEGRLPFLGAKPLAPSAFTPLHTALLWNGFEHISLPKLVAQAQWPNAQFVASWQAAHGDISAALATLKALPTAQREQPNVLIALGKLYGQLQQWQALAHCVQTLQGLTGQTFALRSLQANLALAGYSENGSISQASGRLPLLSASFTNAGLVPVHVDMQQPLSFAALKAKAPLIGHQGPLVSVVMPVHNAANTIGYALNSVLKQSWQALEVIVVDDASTDNTLEQVQRIAQGDARVRVLRNATPLRAYASRNKGMQAAQGEFVTVHDADDWSHPQKIEQQIKPLLANPALQASYSYWLRVAPNLQLVGPWMLGEHFLEKNHSSLLVRRTVLAQIGLWDAVPVAADTEFLWRLEHHVGYPAIASVLPNVPLSFALSATSTLTQMPATHVKTVQYGLRRLYRESAQWWHRGSALKPVLAPCARPFPLPLGMLHPLPTVQHVVVGDFSDSSPSTLNELNQTIAAEHHGQTELGQQLALLHLPQCSRWHGLPVADEIFAWAQQQGVHFAHVGLTLEHVKTATVLSNVQLANSPTRTACLPQLNSLACNEATQPVQTWLQYLQAGGHPWL